MLAEATSHLANVTVDSWQGLLVDYAKANDITAIVKGLRGANDFDYELQMAQMNHKLTGVDTLFVATNPAFGYLSSSLVKEVATYGGDVARHAPGGCPRTAARPHRRTGRCPQRRPLSETSHTLFGFSRFLDTPARGTPAGAALRQTGCGTVAAAG